MEERGYYYDAKTGFYYLQLRYYDPQVGRFINADGIIGANGGIMGYNLKRSRYRFYERGNHH